jgi:hypothetical protein
MFSFQGLLQRLQGDSAFQSPRWVLSGLFAAVATALVCTPVWPGLMSYDSLFAYKQSIDGVETAIWPPMHDYLFYLSRILSGGPGGLFLFQTFGLFFGANLILSMMAHGPIRLAIASICLAALFWIFPTMEGTAIVLWKDVPVATFSMLAIAVWMVAVRASSLPLLGLSLVCIFFGVALRYNSLPIFVPISILLVLDPQGKKTTLGKRVMAALGVLVMLGAAYCSTLWRLPDFRRLPPISSLMTSVQLWDLIGVSARENQNLLPASVNGGNPLSGPELRAIYDPRHINLTFSPPAGVKRLRLPSINVSVDVSARWREIILSHPVWYLQVRLAVLREQLGLVRGEVFYPTHGGIDKNAYGLHSANPSFVSATVDSIQRNSVQLWRRAYILYVLAAVLTGAALSLRLPVQVLALLLTVGAFGNVALLFVSAPAADARYIFPSNVFCSLVIVLVLSNLLTKLVLGQNFAVLRVGWLSNVISNCLTKALSLARKREIRN